MVLLFAGLYLQILPDEQQQNSKVIKNYVETINDSGVEQNEGRKNQDINTFNYNDNSTQLFEEILKKGGESEDNDTSESKNTSGAGTASSIVVGDRAQNKILIESGKNTGSNYSPELDALREAAELFDNRSGSSLIPGFKASNEQNAPEIQAAVQFTAVPTATPNNQFKAVTGQARGYTMLYLMYPKARQTVEKQLDALFRSNVQQLYLGVLIDGTFGRDFNYLTNVIRRVAREKRSLVLVVYLTNGSTMRDFENPVVEAPYNDIDPVIFRSLIRFDSDVRNEYLEIIKPVIPVLQLNKRLNQSNRNYVSVMLEDNLDNESYLSMRTQAQQLIGNRAEFIRNPCGGDGCPEGSTTDGQGDAIERHELSELNNLNFKDGFSLDGTGYTLPGELVAGIPTFDEIKNSAVTAASRGIRYFGLWRFERQGNIKGQAQLPVSEREFEVPSESDILAEIEILRTGLTVVE